MFISKINLIFVSLNNQKDKNMANKESIVIFDGTSYFVEDENYLLPDDEEIVFIGSFDACSKKADELNDELYG